MRISEHAEMLEIKNERGVIYPVLLWDEDNVVLVDAGHPLQIELIDQAVQKAGFTLDKITTIILTHQDIDHIGCVKELIAASPDIQVLAHEEEAPYINGAQTPIKLAAMEANLEHLSDDMKAWYSQLKSGFENRRLKIHKTLTDGEILPICGGIEIIHTPGHTPGHICLYIQNCQMLIAGDALNIDNGELIGANPQYTYDMELALQSIKKINRYPINTVIPYHGGRYVGDIQEALNNLIKG